MSQRHLKGFRCTSCGDALRRAGPSCPSCSATGSLVLAYDLEEVARSLDRAALERREMWMWRYRELLPTDELAELPPLQVGMTPIFGAPRLASWVGVRGLWLKDEGRNPTGSFDDRAAAVAVVEAREAGRKHLVRACRGADAPAFACLAASVGARMTLFAGEGADESALLRAMRLGAQVVRVAGRFADAHRLSRNAAQGQGWFDANADGPFAAEGGKTAGHEIAEQLSERMPDWVVLAGEGFGVAALVRGLREMEELGLVKALPRLLVVERADAQPAAVGSGGKEGSEGSAARALHAALEGRGSTVAVEAAVAGEAGGQMARLAGALTGPCGALALAGLRAAVRQKRVAPEETALVLVDGGACSEAGEEAVPAPIAPTPEGLDAWLAGQR